MSVVKNGAARICQMCSRRRASAIRQMPSAHQRNRCFDNGGMLTVLALTRTQRERTKVTKRLSMTCAYERPRILNVVAFVCLCVRVSFSASVTLSAQSPAQSPAQSNLTFNRDIAPIIWTRCAPCHRPGEVGPFSLLTYDDVRRRAMQIGTVTAKGLMPPWKPEAGKGEFQDERRLTKGEL